MPGSVVGASISYLLAGARAGRLAAFGVLDGLAATYYNLLCQGTIGKVAHAAWRVYPDRGLMAFVNGKLVAPRDSRGEDQIAVRAAQLRLHFAGHQGALHHCHHYSEKYRKRVR